MSEASPELRVGDRERKAVDDRLLAAVGDGVLTLHEYDERSAALWQARTRTELDGLLADLPHEPAPAPARPAPPFDASPRRVVAVMSEDRLSGVVAPGQRVEGYALMGKAVVDLRREDLPDGARVRVRSLMGEVEVQVPPGAVVHLSGFSLMGERKTQVSAGDGPDVHVDAIAVMGSVKVTVGDGAVVRRSPHTLGHVPHARSAPSPAPTSSRLPAPRGRGRRGGLSRLTSKGKALLVPVAVLGAVLLAGPDSASVFGSNVERVASDDRNVQVSTLFGSVTVVVPDDSRVDTGGLVVFGSTDCGEACGAGTDEELIHVRAFGGFGSVEVLTESEYARSQGDDDDDPVVEVERPDD